MGEWWSSLTGVNKGFYVAAAFFSIIFLYQFVMSIIGLAGGETDFDVHGHADADADFDADVHADLDGDFHGDVHADVHLDGHDIESGSASSAADSVGAFRLFSVRAILAFCTMFSWAAAMYLDLDHSPVWAMVYAAGWGLATP